MSSSSEEELSGSTTSSDDGSPIAATATQHITTMQLKQGVHMQSLTIERQRERGVQLESVFEKRKIPMVFAEVRQTNYDLELNKYREAMRLKQEERDARREAAFQSIEEVKEEKAAVAAPRDKQALREFETRRALGAADKGVSTTETLKLINYGVTPEVLPRIAMATTITTLNVTGCGVGSAAVGGVDEIVTLLKSSSCLKHLRLGANKLGEAGAIRLAEGIQKCRSLREIDVSFNNIGDDGCAAICNAVLDCLRCKVEVINMATNNLGPSAGFHLGRILRDHKPIIAMLLWRNKLGSKTPLARPGVENIFDEIRGAEHLKLLDLSYNGIDDYAVKTLLDLHEEGHNRRRKLEADRKEQSRVYEELQAQLRQIKFRTTTTTEDDERRIHTLEMQIGDQWERVMRATQLEKAQPVSNEEELFQMRIKQVTGIPVNPDKRLPRMKLTGNHSVQQSTLRRLSVFYNVVDHVDVNSLVEIKGKYDNHVNKKDAAGGSVFVYEMSKVPKDEEERRERLLMFEREDWERIVADAVATVQHGSYVPPPHLAIKRTPRGNIAMESSGSSSDESTPRDTRPAATVKATVAAPTAGTVSVTGRTAQPAAEDEVSETMSSTEETEGDVVMVGRAHWDVPDVPTRTPPIEKTPRREEPAVPEDGSDVAPMDLPMDQEGDIGGEMGQLVGALDRKTPEPTPEPSREPTPRVSRVPSAVKPTTPPAAVVKPKTPPVAAQKPPTPPPAVVAKPPTPPEPVATKSTTPLTSARKPAMPVAITAPDEFTTIMADIRKRWAIIKELSEKGSPSDEDLRRLEEQRNELVRVKKGYAARLMATPARTLNMGDADEETQDFFDDVMREGDLREGNTELAKGMLHALDTDFPGLIDSRGIAITAAADGCLTFLDMLLGYEGVDWSGTLIEVVSAACFNQLVRIPLVLVIFQHVATFNLSEFKDDLQDVWQGFVEDICSAKRAIPKEDRSQREALLNVILGHPDVTVDCTTAEGGDAQTIFSRAAKEGDIKLLKMLVERNLVTEIGRVQDDKTTALIQGVLGNHAPVVEYLLSLPGDANINHRCDEGSAMDLASMLRRDDKIIAALRNAGAK